MPSWLVLPWSRGRGLSHEILHPASAYARSKLSSTHQNALPRLCHTQLPSGRFDRLSHSALLGAIGAEWLHCSSHFSSVRSWALVLKIGVDAEQDTGGSIISHLPRPYSTSRTSMYLPLTFKASNYFSVLRPECQTSFLRLWPVLSLVPAAVPNQAYIPPQGLLPPRCACPASVSSPLALGGYHTTDERSKPTGDIHQAQVTMETPLPVGLGLRRAGRHRPAISARFTPPKSSGRGHPAQGAGETAALQARSGSKASFFHKKGHCFQHHWKQMSQT